MSPDCPNRVTPSGCTRCRPTDPSHDRAAGCPSSTVTNPASGARGRSSRATRARSGRPAFTARIHPCCRRSAEVTTSTPAPGTSSAICRWASTASTTTGPETTTASSAPGAGGISQYPPSTMSARTSGVNSRRGWARGRVDSRR